MSRIRNMLGGSNHPGRAQVLREAGSEPVQAGERAKNFFRSCGPVVEAALMFAYMPLHLFIISAPFTAPLLRGYMPVTGGWSWLAHELPKRTIERTDSELFSWLFYMWTMGIVLYLAYRCMYWLAFSLKPETVEYNPISILGGAWRFLAPGGVCLLAWSLLPLGVVSVLAVFMVSIPACAVAIEWRM